MSRNAHQDGYIRMPTSALPNIGLRHLASGKDLTIAASDPRADITITGYTEWLGSWEGKTITIGWDWGVVGDVIVVLSRNEIRTNILLVSQDGVPEDAVIARTHLFQWIESKPWRAVATEAALGDDS